jgi:hypothetical protein
LRFHRRRRSYPSRAAITPWGPLRTERARVCCCRADAGEKATAISDKQNSDGVPRWAARSLESQLIEQSSQARWISSPCLASAVSSSRL